MFNVACQARTKAQQRKNAPVAYCCTTDAKPFVACRFAFAFCITKNCSGNCRPVTAVENSKDVKMGQALLIVCCKHKNVFKLQLAYFLIQTTLQHPATNPL
jgi:hypothetical protein